MARNGGTEKKEAVERRKSFPALALDLALVSPCFQPRSIFTPLSIEIKDNASAIVFLSFKGGDFECENVE